MMRAARLIAMRELREAFRDPNLVLPLVLMPCLIGLINMRSPQQCLELIQQAILQ